MDLYNSKNVQPLHKSIIHDVSFDYYGKRFATCSKDHDINIFEQLGTKDWSLIAHWRAHNGPIWKIIWAHPDFGNILASCSYDRTIIIWEETTSLTIPLTKTNVKNKWIKRASIVDSKSSVTSIQFSPYHSLSVISPLNESNNSNLQIELDSSLRDGLLLASASSDGYLRFYEAGVDDPSNLSHWSLIEEINLLADSKATNDIFSTDKDGDDKIQNVSLNISITWSECRIYPLLLAVGVDKPYNPQLKSDEPKKCNGGIKIYQMATNKKKWHLKVKNLANIIKGIKDLKFCPDTGKSYHLLAISTFDIIHIFAIKPSTSLKFGKNSLSYLEKYKAIPATTNDILIYELAYLAPSHKIWRLQWNLSGTVLATATEDACILLWKKNANQSWDCVCKLKNDVLCSEHPWTFEYPSIDHIEPSSNKANYLAKNSKSRIVENNNINNGCNINSPLEVVWH